MILDGWAGPGGISEGLRMLGLCDVGIEIDDAACRTRFAAGHATWQQDITAVTDDQWAAFRGVVTGFVGSPPCPDWSAAGKRVGRTGATGWHVDLVPHIIELVRPEWVVCEQVPEVLPVWREHVRTLQNWEFSAWAGILCAADFGVPQTRDRAFLIARRDGVVALPPEPTHCQGGAVTMFGELKPWVTMAEALGFDKICTCNTIASDHHKRLPPTGTATTECPSGDASNTPIAQPTRLSMDQSQTASSSITSAVTDGVSTSTTLRQSPTEPTYSVELARLLKMPHEHTAPKGIPLPLDQTGNDAASHVTKRAQSPAEKSEAVYTPENEPTAPMVTSTHPRTQGSEPRTAASGGHGPVAPVVVLRQRRTSNASEQSAARPCNSCGLLRSSLAGSRWPWMMPATTVAGDPRITARCHHEEGSQGADARTTEQVRAGEYDGTQAIKLTIQEALILQSFRPDFPLQGTKTKQFEQVGNAVPPLLAAHVVAAVTGRVLDACEAVAV